MTTGYTLNAKSTKAREDTYERADLVVFRKRGSGETAGDDSWVHTTTLDIPDRDGDLIPTRVNQYWEDHPAQIIGSLELDHGRYGRHDLVIRAQREQVGEWFAQAAAAIVSMGQNAGLS